MRTSEWPLIFFTVLIQLSVGFFIALSITYNLIFIKNANVIPKEVSGRLFFFIWPVLLIALTVSLFHLGSPKNAIYVLSNVSNSWLSREILLTIIFSAFAAVVSVLLYYEIFSPLVRHMILVICAALGLVLIFTMSRLYMLETVPAWNSYSTPISFFLTSFVLGILSFLIGLQYLFRQYDKNIFLSDQTGAVSKILLGFCIALVIIELASWLLHLKLLSGGIAASKESFSYIVNDHTFLFVLRIALSALVLFLLSYAFYGFNKNINGSGLVYLSYGLVILIELAGRYLFYAMYARIGV